MLMTVRHIFTKSTYVRNCSNENTEGCRDVILSGQHFFINKNGSKKKIGGGKGLQLIHEP